MYLTNPEATAKATESYYMATFTLVAYHGMAYCMLYGFLHSKSPLFLATMSSSLDEW